MRKVLLSCRERQKTRF